MCHCNRRLLYRVGWMIWICYSSALERRCLDRTIICRLWFRAVDERDLSRIHYLSSEECYQPWRRRRPQSTFCKLPNVLSLSLSWHLALLENKTCTEECVLPAPTLWPNYCVGTANEVTPAGLFIQVQLLMMRFWKLPLAGGPILQLPTAQANRHIVF